MREYKFRGRYVREKNLLYPAEDKWVYGSLVIDYECNYWIRDGSISYKVLPETIGQFTGLHDKNGVEIYEGSRCLAALPKERFEVRVVWSDEHAGFVFQWDCDTYEDGLDEMTPDCFTDIEVIGDIHEMNSPRVGD